MIERGWNTKADLLGEIERAWSALHAGLDELTDPQMTTITDAQNWTAKDHLLHLAAWERSVVFLLGGKARHEGLGVDEDLFLNNGYDEINDAIYLQPKDLSLEAALEQLQDVHGQQLDLLRSLTDADLQRPYRAYSSYESNNQDDSPVINLIYGNTAHHFTEHLGWIDEMLESV